MKQDLTASHQNLVVARSAKDLLKAEIAFNASCVTPVKTASGEVPAHFRWYVQVLKTVIRCNQIPKGPDLLRCIEEGRWRDLYDLAGTLSKQKYSTAGSHFSSTQFSALVKKYPWPSFCQLGFDPEAKARRAFYSSEWRCRRMNAKFRIMLSRRDPYTGVLQVARDWIAYVLGYTVPDFLQDCDFGSGASLGVHGNRTHLERKLSSEMTVTPRASALARDALWANRHYSEVHLTSKNGIACIDPVAFSERYRASVKYVEHNQLAFVPKTTEIHRCIAVEPTLNQYLQKGIDQVMRRRLKRVGIDLSDQEQNKRMAWKGSLQGDDPYCTIDLSSASDSISIELVRYLLPPAWFDVLYALRARSYEDQGSLHVYEKFCSMGNGFCFPLETLIFGAICKAAGSKEFAVYGDDIIVRASVFDEVIKILRICGFKTNVQKTFGEGPFRESCGADWYAGNNVRPFTLDFALDSLKAVHKFLNLSRRNWRTEYFFREANLCIIKRIPTDALCTRPFWDEESEGGINPSDLLCPEIDEPRWFMWVKRHWARYVWFELASRPLVDHASVRSAPPWLQMAACLRGASPSAMFVVRRKTKACVLVKKSAGATSVMAVRSGITPCRDDTGPGPSNDVA